MTDAQVTAPSKLIVTGNEGFVGRHFCSRYGGVALADADGAVDLCDAPRVHAAVAALKPEAVLHLAARSSVASSIDDPAGTFAVNLLGTLNLLQALSAIRFQGVFLYVGSADVYGKKPDADLPTRETQLLRPCNPYAVSKVAAEALCYSWSQTQNFRVVLTRPFNQIGPGQDRRFAIPDFAHQIYEIGQGQRPPVLTTGDIDVTRDFTDVRDTVSAYRMLLDKGENGEVYNVCSGRERTIRSLIEGLMRIAGVEAEIRVNPSRLRPGEQRRAVGDPAKLQALLGWKPAIELETTLADILRENEENR